MSYSFRSLRRAFSASFVAACGLRMAAATALLLAALSVSPARAVLVSHWALNDGAPSQTAVDPVNGNDLTLGGSVAVNANDPTWIPGLIGSNALDFDGGDYAIVASNPSLEFSAGLTISTWVRRDDPARPREIFLGKGDGQSSATTTFWLDFLSGDQPDFYLSTGGTGHSLSSPGPIVNDTNWHHLVGTYDGSVQRLYLDGIQVNSASFAGSITVNTKSFGIGRLGDYGGEYLDGKLDDVGLWSHALSAAQVRALVSLAEEAALDYDAGAADQLFELYLAGSGEVTLGSKTWINTSGLSGGLGLVQQVGSNFFLQLDVNGTGLQTFTPAPEPSSFFLLMVGSLALKRCRKLRAKNIARA